LRENGGPPFGGFVVLGYQQINAPFCDGVHSRLNRGDYFSDKDKERRAGRITMLGFEVIGLALLALLTLETGTAN
jgi:hypothetical protein